MVPGSGPVAACGYAFAASPDQPSRHREARSTQLGESSTRVMRLLDEHRCGFPTEHRVRDIEDVLGHVPPGSLERRRRSWIASAAHPLAGPSAGVVHAPPFCSPSTTPTTRCSAKWQLGSLIHEHALLVCLLSDGSVWRIAPPEPAVEEQEEEEGDDENESAGSGEAPVGVGDGTEAPPAPPLSGDKNKIQGNGSRDR